MRLMGRTIPLFTSSTMMLMIIRERLKNREKNLIKKEASSSIISCMEMSAAT